MKKSTVESDSGETSPVSTACVKRQAVSAKRQKADGVVELAADSAPQLLPRDENRTLVALGSAQSLLEAIGNQISATHAQANGACVEALLSAAKCGFLLLAAKTAVKSGEFEAWFERCSFGFTKVTRCKYMRLADRICGEAGSKPGLLLTIDPGIDGLPAAFIFDELRLRAVILSVSDGRSLSDLYVDWGITKRFRTEDEAASIQRKAKGGSSPTVVFGRWSGIVEAVPKVFLQLKREEQDQLLSGLERLLTKLQAFRHEISPGTDSN